MATPAPQLAAPTEPADEKRMPFLAHLDELRSCLRNSAVALFVGTIIAYAFRTYLFALLERPLITALNAMQQKTGVKPMLHYLSPLENFMVPFKLSLLSGVFIASPMIFREIWRFVAPGLYVRERRWGLLFVLTAVILFVGGAAFAYAYVLPASFHYFLSLMGGGQVDTGLSLPFEVTPMITMEESYGLIIMLLLVFGIAFELPLLLAILSMLGIVSPQKLWSFNRYAIVLFAVLGAVLTPGDLVVGQLAMTASLTVLYNLSILLAFVVGKKRKERAEAEERAYREPQPPAN